MVVTRGKDGIVGKFGKTGEPFEVAAVHLETIVDTVGAGDACNAGFLSQFIQHDAASVSVRAMQAAAEVACLNASYQVLQRGAVEQVGTADELRRFAKAHGVKWSGDWAVAQPCPALALHEDGAAPPVAHPSASPSAGWIGGWWVEMGTIAAAAFIMGLYAAKLGAPNRS